MSEKANLQLELYLAHKECQEEDKRKRNVNRIYRIHLDNIQEAQHGIG